MKALLINAESIHNNWREADRREAMARAAEAQAALKKLSEQAA